MQVPMAFPGFGVRCNVSLFISVPVHWYPLFSLGVGPRVCQSYLLQEPRSEIHWSFVFCLSVSVAVTSALAFIISPSQVDLGWVCPCCSKVLSFAITFVFSVTLQCKHLRVINVPLRTAFLGPRDSAVFCSHFHLVQGSFIPFSFPFTPDFFFDLFIIIMGCVIFTSLYIY